MSKTEPSKVASVYAKLLSIKEAVPYLKKDKKGFNYSYVTPSQVLSTINPLLLEKKLLLITNVIDSKSYEIAVPTKANKDNREWKFDLDFIFDWVDTETGEKVSIPWKASGVNGQDKGLGSALTYAERYFILKQFNIPTDEDDPDSFQDKYLTKEEKAQKEKEQKAEDMVIALSGVAKAETIINLNGVWNKFLSLHNEPEFKSAVEKRKHEIEPPPVPWHLTAELQKELQGLINNSTLDKAKQDETAEYIRKNAASEASINAVRTNLLKIQKPTI